MQVDFIRNFCIIAHIDHGKSTLSDRLIEITGTVDKRKLGEQMLDSLEIEKERGITIKSAAVTLNFRSTNGESYLFNLIDTPGHVDFNYEVSRSLAACEGALLIIDATQGVEAQTLANYFLALEADLTIVPVINKIDLPSSDISRVTEQIVKELGFKESEILKVSAKKGTGIPELLDKIIERVPPPEADKDGKLKCLVFDSFFDIYRGAVICARVFQGKIEPGDKVQFIFGKKNYEVEEVGYLGLARKKKNTLVTGEVGYIILGIRSVGDIRIGDTLTGLDNPTTHPLPGYNAVKPMVFAGVFPINPEEYNDLKSAIEKLKLNDAALQYEADNSLALGFGFRCGFLGLLHMEVVQDRLDSEFHINVLLTAPSVRYEIRKKEADSWIIVDNPAKMPDPIHLEAVKEPYVRASIITPAVYLGNIMQLVQDKRGSQTNIHYLNTERVEGVFELPLAEILFDFYDKLKSCTKGYASLDYELTGYHETEISKVDILVNKEVVDALSFLVHKDKARNRGKFILAKLRNEIPRHMFPIPLQAAIGSNVIARENISALRKDVTAKCYGGDVSRKRKLLEKQKEGKKKMKSIGKVDIPQRAFINILKS